MSGRDEEKAKELWEGFWAGLNIDQYLSARWLWILLCRCDFDIYFAVRNCVYNAKREAIALKLGPP